MFLTKRAGADRSPWGDFWFEPVGMRSATGARVTAESAMRLSAVYACVRVLAETMAVLPIRVYRQRADGGKDILRDHWLSRLLGRRPNRWQNAYEWREMLQGHLALRGNAYCRIMSNARGEIIELLPVHPDAVTIEALPSGEYRYKLRKRDGTEDTLPRGEVWHLRGLSSDGVVGLSPLELARETIGVGLSAQEYGARFFANDAKPGGWIEFPGAFKDRAARELFRESWQAAQGAGNRHKTAVLESGMKFHEIAVSNEDAQFLETRHFQVQEIARIFRIPPHMIGDLTRSTFSNIEHQGLEFATHTMTPWVERWEAAIETELLVEDDVEVEFDLAGLLRGDQAARAAFYASGISNGWLTRNEARLAENLQPIDGLDEPLQPLNMTTAEQADAAEDAAMGETDATEEDAAQEDAADLAPPEAIAPSDRLAAVLRSNARRMARRIVRERRVDVSVVAEALGLPGESVQAWAARLTADASEDVIAQELVDLA